MIVANATISPRCLSVTVSGGGIRPPFGSLAKATMARSMSARASARVSPFAVCWVGRWVYSLALYAMLQMSVWTISLILAILHTTVCSAGNSTRFMEVGSSMLPLA